MIVIKFGVSIGRHGSVVFKDLHSSQLSQEGISGCDQWFRVWLDFCPIHFEHLAELGSNGRDVASGQHSLSLSLLKFCVVSREDDGFSYSVR